MTNQEFEQMRTAQCEGHRRDFEKWVKAKNVTVYTDPAEIGIETDLRVGDKVTFVNDYGVVFHHFTVLGFRNPDPNFCPQSVVYLDMDCYWAPTELRKLTKESN